MSAHTPMSEREYRAIINRQYHLPYRITRARARLAELEAESAWRGLSADGRPTRSERHCRLPAMILSTRRRLEALESEARRYGMPELVERRP